MRLISPEGLSPKTGKRDHWGVGVKGHGVVGFSGMVEPLFPDKETAEKVAGSLRCILRANGGTGAEGTVVGTVFVKEGDAYSVPEISWYHGWIADKALRHGVKGSIFIHPDGLPHEK